MAGNMSMSGDFPVYKDALGVLAGQFKPKGLAIDDEPGGFLTAIEHFADDCDLPMEIEALSAAEPRELVEKSKGRHFLLVDHRLRDKFAGYRDGLEVVERLKKDNPRVPVFYYTAFEGDLYSKGSSESARVFNERAASVIRQPGVYFYEKAELQPDRRLREFAELVYWQAVSYVLGSLRNEMGAEILHLLKTNPVNSKVRRFKILGKAGRGSVRIQEVSKKRALVDEVVPSRLLRRAGVGIGEQYVSHRVVEFKAGQVLSYFFKSPLRSSEMGAEALKALGELCGDRG